jgi:hypothetical protein
MRKIKVLRIISNSGSTWKPDTGYERLEDAETQLHAILDSVGVSLEDRHLRPEHSSLVRQGNHSAT